VQDRISWYEGDCFEVIGRELAKLGKHSVIFASPPWGGKSKGLFHNTGYLLTSKGPGYRSDTVFDLANMQPYTLNDMLDPFQRVTSDVVLYLPRTSNLRQVANQTKGKKTIVMHYCMEGASKVRCVVSSLMVVHLT